MFGYGQWHISTKAPFIYVSHGDQYDPNIKRRPNPYSDDPVLEPPSQEGSWVGYTEMRKREKAREAKKLERENSVERRLRLAKKKPGGTKEREEMVMEAEEEVAVDSSETHAAKTRTMVGHNRTLTEESERGITKEETKEGK